MNLLSPVSNIMSTDLITLSPEDSVAKAGEIFEKQKIHHLPVTKKNGELLGIVSKSDYLFFRNGFKNSWMDKKLEEIRLNNYKISEIMTTGLAKMEPTDRINVALEIFNVNIFHAIPVVEKGRLVGIVTTFDIIKQLSVDNQAVAEY